MIAVGYFQALNLCVCVCALLCVRVSMCGSIRGGHISRVSRG